MLVRMKGGALALSRNEAPGSGELTAAGVKPLER